MRPVPVDARRHLHARRTTTTLAVGLVTAVLLTGCGGSSGAGSTPKASDDQGRATRAAALLDRFAAAQQGSSLPTLAVLPDDLERQDGDWEEAVGENDKLAYLSGHLTAARPLPDSPGQGTVVDAAGKHVATEVVSAQEALAAMTTRRSDCNGCTDLRVMSGRLTTMDVRTSSGSATVPAWRFSLEGTQVALLRVAVPESGLVLATPPEAFQPQPGDGARVDSFSLVPNARTLRLHFAGAPDEPGPCGADYRAERYSSGQAVVVTVQQIPREAAAKDIACPAIVALRMVDVVLDTALGTRAVLSLAGGTLVPRDSGQVQGIPVR